MGVTLATCLRCFALVRARQTALLVRWRDDAAVDVMVWVRLVRCTLNSGDAVVGRESPDDADLQSLRREWRCFADGFLAFLVQVARHSEAEPDEMSGVYKLDYKFGHRLMRRLSPMVLQACGVSSEHGDDSLDGLAACVEVAG